MPTKPIVAAAAAVALLSAAVVPARAAEPVKNIVLVHGAFADGSGWRSVADILGKDGYTVSVVQEPLTSLADDVAATKRVLDLQQGPTILVGHSYGGVVITEAGNAPNVAGLVYIAAFIPDQGESALDLLSQAPPPTTTCAPPRTIFCTLSRPPSPPISPPTCRLPRRTSWPIPRRCWPRPPPRANGDDGRLAQEEELGAGRDARPQYQSRSRTQHGQEGRQRNDRGSRQPRGLHLQAGRSGAFDRTGGKGLRPVMLLLVSLEQLDCAYNWFHGARVRPALPPPARSARVRRASDDRPSRGDVGSNR